MHDTKQFNYLCLQAYVSFFYTIHSTKAKVYVWFYIDDSIFSQSGDEDESKYDIS